MNKTLLDVVQDILSVMDGDEVNSIYDTEESEQVAKIVIRTYNSLVSASNWYHTRKGLKLVASGDSERPTHMRLQDNVKQIEFINYNTQKKLLDQANYERMHWKEPDDFLRYINLRNTNNSYVKRVEDYSGIELLILTNKQPEYYTSFDDTNIVFDSLDLNTDDTLLSSKTQAFGYTLPSLKLSDDAVPELPPEAWSQFIEEATAKCQWLVRQFMDEKSEQEANRQRRWMSRNQWRVHGGVQFRDYGRKTGYGPYTGSYRRYINNEGHR